MAALNVDSIPAELKSKRQWLLWRWEYVQDDEGERITKPPYRPCGSPAATDDPTTWVTFEEAVAAHKTKEFSGIGFVLTSVNGFVGVDLDHVRDPATGETKEWAQDIVNRLDSYTEISPSGTGLRIFVYGALPSKGRKRGDFEFYESGRYLTVTGEHLHGTSWTIAARHQELADIHLEIFGQLNRVGDSGDWTEPEALSDLNDDELLKLAFSARNGTATERLYKGDTSGYYSASEADLALCSRLAFFVFRDIGRIDRLFRASGLYRLKWDRPTGSSTYGDITIRRALDNMKDFSNSEEDRSDSQQPTAVFETTQTARGFQLTSLSDLLAEPPEEHQFIWADILPTRGLSILASKPKVGKSTIARCLALAVARGEPFLGRATVQGPVVYLALEEKRSEVQSHFAQMGGTGEEIYTHFGPSPQNGLYKLEKIIDKYQPVLIITDPLLKFIKVDDTNEYAEMSAALEPLLSLARESSAHILCCHHLVKGERSGFDAILGSTAILGCVDTGLMMRKKGEQRLLISDQRYGQNLPETLINLDKMSGMVVDHGTLADTEVAAAKERIIEAIGDGDLTQKDIRDQVEGRTTHVVAALQQLRADGELTRDGKGGKGDPYRYSVKVAD